MIIELAQALLHGERQSRFRSGRHFLEEVSEGAAGGIVVMTATSQEM